MIDPLAFMISLSAAQATSPVVVTARRSCRRCGRRMSILPFSYILLCCVAVTQCILYLSYMECNLSPRSYIRFYHDSSSLVLKGQKPAATSSPSPPVTMVTIVKFTQLCSKFPPTALLNFACDG